ncbi:MAG: hypothetical protein JST54_29355 [Deltaproteobacteria bacterium]|nr:hypothetical protein [Deltaproteobacteria bacterium]
MQDVYAFDVGDFGKLGLLRHLLAGPRAPRLGVLWYATALPSAAQDGKHIDYLELPRAEAARFRDCDPALYDRFRAALRRPRAVRSMAALERLRVWPTDTRFHRVATPSGDARTPWFQAAQGALADCGAIFCDPDNGVANPDSENERRCSAKHALLHELSALADAGHGLVVYHHLTREKGGHAAQIGRWMAVLKRRTGARNVAALRFCRGTSRAFFVLDGPRAPNLVNRLGALQGSPWIEREHAELFLS